MVVAVTVALGVGVEGTAVGCEVGVLWTKERGFTVTLAATSSSIAGQSGQGRQMT